MAKTIITADERLGKLRAVYPARRASGESRTKHALGSNESSQLGLEGAGSDPVLQPGEPIERTTSNEELRFRHLAAGVRHTCGVTDEHEARVFCWGTNAVGQLGTDSVSDHSAVPHEVELP